MSQKNTQANPKKKREFPHAFVILFSILIIMVLCTWLVPAGSYTRVEVNGTMMVDPNSFTYVEPSPVGFMGLFQSIPLGIQNGIGLITMIFTIGAAIGLVDSTGAIRASVHALSDKLGSKNSKFVLMGLMLFFAMIGAFPSMLEGTIPFIPIGCSIALMLGYDVVTGVAVVFIADIIGWAAGPTNFYTVGTAQNIGGLPLFSGIGFRLITLVVFSAVSIWYVLRYAERVRKNPELSVVAGRDYSDLRSTGEEKVAFTARRKIIFALFLVTILLVVVGSLQWKWGMLEMSATYLICGIVCGIVAGFPSGKIADGLLDGAKSVFIAAMAIGLARAISLVMENGKIIDTFVHALVGMLDGLPAAVTGIGMFVVQTILNFFIPSGSSQALVTMPILMPLADIVGLSKQLTILAFQFGDGLSNLCFPTMGALVACLTYARIPFDRWFKFIWKYMLLIWGTAAVLIIVASLIGY